MSLSFASPSIERLSPNICLFVHWSHHNQSCIHIAILSIWEAGLRSLPLSKPKVLHFCLFCFDPFVSSYCGQTINMQLAGDQACKLIYFLSTCYASVGNTTGYDDPWEIPWDRSRVQVRVTKSWPVTNPHLCMRVTGGWMLIDQCQCSTSLFSLCNSNGRHCTSPLLSGPPKTSGSRFQLQDIGIEVCPTIINFNSIYWLPNRTNTTERRSLCHVAFVMLLSLLLPRSRRRGCCHLFNTSPPTPPSPNCETEDSITYMDYILFYYAFLLCWHHHMMPTRLYI